MIEAIRFWGPSAAVGIGHDAKPLSAGWGYAGVE
jgi:hypothetical protein